MHRRKLIVLAAYFIIFIFFNNDDLLAQNKKIQVISSISKTPVSYSSIKSNNLLVVADTNGFFMIPDTIKSITISCVGYVTETFNNVKINNTLFLQPATYLLNDILVRPLDFREFFLRFSEKKAENLEQNPFDAKFFYREFTKVKGQYVDFNEAFGLYHFEGMGNYENVNANNLIKTIYQVRSLNLLVDRKMGLHQVNWLASANNLNKYLIFNFSFYSSYDWKIDKVISESIDGDLIEVSFKPKKSDISLFKSRQWRRRDLHAGAIGAEGKVYIDNKTLQIKKFVFTSNNFRNDLRSYRVDNKNNFSIKKASGELTFTENQFGKTVPLFVGYNISYFLKEKPSELIEKRLEFYFSDYDLKNQETSDLEKKYKSKIVYEFPTRAMISNDNEIFSGAAPYNEIFWKKELSYPQFYDIEKVKSDLKAQGVDMDKKFREFTNKYK